MSNIKLEHRSEGEGIEVIAKDQAGNVVGRSIVRPDGNGNIQAYPWVNESNRRQGIASAMYDYAEKQTGLPIKPGTYQTAEGKAFSDARILGKSNKSKILKSLPLIGTALGAYAALDSGDVMAAVPGLDSAEDVGESAMDEKQMLAEHDARVNYDQSPARFDKIRKMLGK